MTHTVPAKRGPYKKQVPEEDREVLERNRSKCDADGMRCGPSKLLFVTLALAGCASSQPVSTFQLRAAVDQRGNCTLTLDGQFLDAHELTQALNKRGSREVHLTGMELSTPFRCVGPLIAALQQSNVPMKVGFISEPPPDDHEPVSN